MRDKKDAKVIDYLNAENAYTDSLTNEQQPLREHLYTEMLARIQQTDLTVPYRKGSWLYYSRTEEGKQYPIYCRKHGSETAPEQVLLDLNKMAEGHTYMAIGDFEVSPDENLLAYTTDDNGYRQYRLHVKDLTTGDTLTVTDERVTSLAWTADSRTLFYTQEDAVSKRSYRLYVRDLNQPNPVAQDEERDERFDVSVELSRSGEWLFYTISSHTTSEVRVLRADQPTGQWVTISPRVQDREYYVDHRRGEFWIRVNDKGRNYRLVTAPVATPDPSHWTEVVAHRDDVMLLERRVLRAPRRVDRARARAAADHRAGAGEASHPARVVPRGGLHRGARDQRRVRPQGVPVRLPVVHHAAQCVRPRHRDAGFEAAEAHGGAGRLGCVALRDGAHAGHGGRRHQGAGDAALPEGLPEERHARRACCTRTARTASPATSRSPPPASAWWTAAWCTRWRTSAAAAIWARSGTMPAACRTR